jgi:adenosylcobinamide kinase / adenosylcobinamide-phosphate guanylyltransferase
MSIYFVAGGARSGKSRKGEELAKNLAGSSRPIFIATAEAVDEEMTSRIKKHQDDRGTAFDLVEAPKNLTKALKDVDADATVLVDCLTLWLSNNMMGEGTDTNQSVIDAARARKGATIFISNEVGEGIVPMHPVSREFRDLSGIMNQQFAQAADKVYFMKFGIAQELK